MILKRIPRGMFSSNCYIVGDQGEGVVVDPGMDPEDLLEAVDKLSLKIKYILITHTHIDHMCSVDRIREATGAKVAVHEADAVGFSDVYYNGSLLFAEASTFRQADILLKDGDILETGGLQFKILHTPGHSDGGICILVGNTVLSGDTLFRLSIGRTDLGNGDEETLVRSIREKLLVLPDETEVYPGHGPSTTIGNERMYNPYL